jgi:mannose-1-phosphate guanylyltransferase
MLHFQPMSGTAQAGHHEALDREVAVNLDPWIVLLAGGEGTRLRGHRVAGELVDRPKQFCRFGAPRTLLATTLERALRMTCRSRVIVVVTDEHRAWWEPELTGISAGSVLAQSRNRGTGMAILSAVFHILQRDPSPTIVILPCDHGVADESPLRHALEVAVREARECRHIVLLGVRPDHPETEYGWILPGEPASDSVSGSVRAFVEKPTASRAATLMEAGALWNTFMVAASGRVLLQSYRETLPELVSAYAQHPQSLVGLGTLYERLPPCDFSRDIMQGVRETLRVVPVAPCGWTDLGTPHRVLRWMETQDQGQGTRRTFCQVA